MENEVSVKEFIKESLIQIAEGIKDAQEEMRKSLGGNQPIAPAYVEGNVAYKESNISFDIAVNTSSNKDLGVNGKVGISIAGATIDGNLQSCKEYINRIQFQVPFYPQGLSTKSDK